MLPVKPGQVYPNQGLWVNPFLLPTIKAFQTLCGQISESHTMHHGKAQMKIQEDPWENFLYHDSAYILPLICHSQEMGLEE